MTRLFSGLLLTCLLSLFLLGYLIDRVIDNEQLPSRTETLSAHLLDYLVSQGNLLPEQQLHRHYQQQATALGLNLQLEPYQALALPPELTQQLAAPGGLALASSEQDYRVKQLPAHPGWLLKLALPPEQEHHPLSLWLTLGLYIGLALLLLLWLWPLVNRLNLLTRLAERFGRGEHEIRLPASRLSYIPQLEHSFNQMAEQISQLLHENRLLAKSLSHDLRTPIACLRFGLEAVQEAETPDKKQQLLLRMEQDVDRMEAMVNSFLEFASLSRTALTLQFQSRDLTQWLAAYHQTIEPLVLQHQLQLSLRLPDEAIYSQINLLWLERALSNIISNGCRFAYSRLQLTLAQQQQYAVISISDDGPGIAEEDQLRVLQPFVRLGTAATSTEPHFGLGLAIVTEVMKWHHGSITVDRNQELRGARFNLYLALR
ncbi:ATP-binding protein [Chromatiaceae bacterium AAb-1]|nr:ATP-binding protein [Chromatiaceae bacterium AAb-1]